MAKDTLLFAPAAIREMALYHYNLACYECQLGRVAEAKQLLKVCFGKERTYRGMALDDPDLAPLWNTLSGI